MSERKHAILSASGAYRWLACPPSGRENIPAAVKQEALERLGRARERVAKSEVTM